RRDRGGAERARRMPARDTQGERRDARLVGGEGLEDGPDWIVAGRVMVGAGADEREHARRIRDCHGPEAELLEDLVGDRARGPLREPETQLRECRGEKLER